MNANLMGAAGFRLNPKKGPLLTITHFVTELGYDRQRLFPPFRDNPPQHRVARISPYRSPHLDRVVRKIS
jgi:hypothetical protein